MDAISLSVLHATGSRPCRNGTEVVGPPRTARSIKTAHLLRNPTLKLWKESAGLLNVHLARP